MTLLPLISITSDGTLPSEHRNFRLTLSGMQDDQLEHYVLDWFDTKTAKQGNREFNSLKDLAQFLSENFDFFLHLNTEISKLSKKKKEKKSESGAIKEDKNNVSKSLGKDLLEK